LDVAVLGAKLDVELREVSLVLGESLGGLGEVEHRLATMLFPDLRQALFRFPSHVREDGFVGDVLGDGDGLEVVAGLNRSFGDGVGESQGDAFGGGEAKVGVFEADKSGLGG